MSALLAAAALAAAAGWSLAAACGLALVRRAERAARAAHEIAGPLHAAGLALALARREGPAPRLEAVELELRRAARALDDLRPPAPRPATAAPPAAAAPRVVDAGTLAAQQALAWQGAGRLRVAARSGALVEADPVRLAQAVGNLLANAFEHGRGQVELRVAVAGDGVRIGVRDQGVGLAALPRRRRPLAPRGHGLAVAAEVAREAGGRLALDDEGFPVLVLPAAARPASAPATPLALPAGPRRAPRRPRSTGRLA